MKKFWRLFSGVLVVLIVMMLTFISYMHLLEQKQPTPPSQGSFSLVGNPIPHEMIYSCFDLDIGEYSDTGSADLCFTASAGSMVFYTLSPVNDARARVMGKTTTTLEDCYDRIETFSKGNIPELEISNTICFYTNLQRLAVLTIQQSRRLSPTEIEITIDYSIR